MGDWVRIIHPETGGIAEVNRSSLPQHYTGGWRLLTGEEDRALEPEPAAVPEPVTREQAAQAAQATETEPEEQ